MPLATYFPKQTEHATIAQAITKYESECLARWGITNVRKFSDNKLLTGLEGVRVRYGDLEGPAARGEDSQLEFSLGEWGEWEPNDDREYAVMYGTGADDARPGGGSAADNAGNPIPEGGCRGEAQRRVAGDYEWFSELTHRLEKVLAETMNRTKAHPKVKEVQARVDGCITAAGFDLPKEAGPGSGEVPGLEPAYEEQFRKCAAQENLPGWLYAVDIEYQRRWLETEGAGLLENHKRYQETVAAAADALGR